MSNFTRKDRLFDQLFGDLNEVFNKVTVFNYDDSLSDDEFDSFDNVKRISRYLVRDYIRDTYGYKKNDPMTIRLEKEWVRKNYGDGNMPMVGDTIEMVKMVDDPNPIPPGSKGVVRGYTTIGGPFYEDHIDIEWENNRNLSLIVGVDDFKVVKRKWNI